MRSRHTIVIGPDPLDIFYALLEAQRRTGGRAHVRVRPYFSPRPGYEETLNHRIRGPLILAGKMACLASEKYMRAVTATGRVKLVLLTYSYCADRIREKAKRAGADVEVEEIGGEKPGRWLPPSKMFRLWVSTRYLASYLQDELNKLIRRVQSELLAPEIDWQAASKNLIDMIINKFYSPGILAAESLADKKLERKAKEPGVEVYLLHDKLDPQEYNLISIAAKHHANRKGLITVYLRRGNVTDYIIIAVPVKYRNLRADRLALTLARQGLLRLKIYDAGRNLVEGIARINSQPREIATRISRETLQDS